MFYDKQTQAQKENYKNMLSKIGLLSGLFSSNDIPLLYYRAHENCFCKYFNADNLGRFDCSADAKQGNLGIGLKTWMGSDTQKIAEFGKARSEFEGLTTEELIRLVAEYRNERIRTTKNIYNIDTLIYHIIKRESGKMLIKECPFDLIDTNNLRELPERNGRNTYYFTDGIHVYSFNKAKTTLYMTFDCLETLDEIPVQISSDPYHILASINNSSYKNNVNDSPKLCLKLYTNSVKRGPYVPMKSGLNQWNASGRKRDENEVYIPFPAHDRKREENINFFPSRGQDFNLILPNDKIIKAKVCQDDGKAIMSNPNSDLGKWLLRDVLELKGNQIIDYVLLQKKGFDAVIFEKISGTSYKINFTNSSTYDSMYGVGS